MQTTNFTEARNNLKKIIFSVEKNSEPIIILGTKGRHDSVLISKSDYDNLIENLYILSNNDWVKSIGKGVEELETNKGSKLDLYAALGL